MSLLCRVMRVSRSGFYNFLQRCKNPPDNSSQQALERCAQAVFEENKRVYGSRRLGEELGKKGFRVGRYRTRSLMRKLGLKARTPRRYKVTTDSGHSFAVAPNIVGRKFTVDAPNKVWTTDLTYVWTLEGWLYLAVVMDLFSRQIVGWAMANHMKVQLALDALLMAYWRRKPAAGLTHHSDRGIQYACDAYQRRVKSFNMVPSMSRKGNCWDNAPTERFFRSLKSEYLSYYRFGTREQARSEVLEYITFYNTDRLHSTLGYLSPMEFERFKVPKAA